VGADYQRDYRGYQRSSDERYDRGFPDGVRARPAALDIPPGMWANAVAGAAFFVLAPPYPSQVSIALYFIHSLK
jgi:hypothetical protein